MRLLNGMFFDRATYRATKKTKIVLGDNAWLYLKYLVLTIVLNKH